MWGLQGGGKVRVAVIREEGSNGDREMAAAVWSGGMEPWDLTMSDLLNGRASLDSFQGKHRHGKDWDQGLRMKDSG